MRVLFLDLDTLRPDHLGCYGYHRDTSPNIDSVAKEGVRFTNYHCSDAPCLPSRAALVSGRFGIHTGCVGHGGTAGDFRLEGAPRGFKDKMESQSLWATFRKAGFKTVSISPFAERHSAWWFYSGFSEMHNTGKSGNESAEEITPTVMKWIENNAQDDNWLLHINYWDPHTPYRAPDEYWDVLKDDPIPDWFAAEKLEHDRTQPGFHGAREISMWNNQGNPKFPKHLGEVKDMKDARQFFQGYDTGIRYMDTHIGWIFDALKKKGVWDDTAIIITSDHGENLAELGCYAEHATADEITTRIPMIIKWPKCKAGHAAEGFHYNVDLVPTIAELCGIDPGSSWDGKSYAKSLTEGEDCGHEYLVVSQCAHTCQRGVRWGDWLYMRTWHDFYHLWPEEMLFNLKDDPHEEHNLAEANPELCRQGAWYLQDWHDKMMMSMEYQMDPMWTVMREGGPLHSRGHLQKYCKYLEETGRAWAIPELKKRHPGEFTNHGIKPE